MNETGSSRSQPIFRSLGPEIFKTDVDSIRPHQLDLIRFSMELRHDAQSLPADLGPSSTVGDEK